MRKLMSVILCLALCLSLAACGDGLGVSLDAVGDGDTIICAI